MLPLFFPFPFYFRRMTPSPLSLLLFSSTFMTFFSSSFLLVLLLPVVRPRRIPCARSTGSTGEEKRGDSPVVGV